MGRICKRQLGTFEVETWQTTVGRPYVRITLGLPLAPSREGRAALRRSRARTMSCPPPLAPGQGGLVASLEEENTSRNEPGA